MYFGIYKNNSIYNVVKFTNLDYNMMSEFEYIINREVEYGDNGNWGNIYSVFKVDKDKKQLIPTFMDINGWKTEVQFKSGKDWHKDEYYKSMYINVFDINNVQKQFKTTNSIDFLIKELVRLSSSYFTWDNYEINSQLKLISNKVEYLEKANEQLEKNIQKLTTEYDIELTSTKLEIEKLESKLDLSKKECVDLMEKLRQLKNMLNNSLIFKFQKKFIIIGNKIITQL